MNPFQVSMLRHNGNSFCEATVEIRPYNGNWTLSICGTAGAVMSRAQARWSSQEFWESYFEEGETLAEMNERMGTKFRSSYRAARYVRANDGEYAGCDVVAEIGNKVLCVYSCGQIRTELTQWFPELIPFFQYHLESPPIDVAFSLGVVCASMKNSASIRAEKLPEAYAPMIGVNL